MTMDRFLLCYERTAASLIRVSSGACDLKGFFEFERYERTFLNTDLLLDCHFVSLWPAHRVALHVPPGLPDPALFRERLPEVINSLLPPDCTLYLHIKAVAPEFFRDEDEFMAQIKSLGVEYMLLSPIADKASDFGNLFFECPLSFLLDLITAEFPNPFATMEGYIVQKGEFGQLAECYFHPDSVKTIRRLLSVIRLGFLITPDGNGMYIFSERHSAEDLARIIPECRVFVPPKQQ